MEELLKLLLYAKPEIEDAAVLLESEDLYGQGIIDSLDIMIILDELNAAYGIAINNAGLRREDFMTVENIYKLVQRYLAQQEE